MGGNLMKSVLILFGGNSAEHLVSCMSAKEIRENIDTDRFLVSMAGISKENVWYEYNDDLSILAKGEWLEAEKIVLIDNIVEYLKGFDVVFPIIHGCQGEDGKLQGLFEMIGINYVGNGVLSSAVTFDKGYSKILCDYYDIPQTDYVVFHEREFNKNTSVLCEKRLGYPMIVKPANGGSSIGIGICKNKREFNRCVKEALKFDSKVVVEEFVKAIDIECGYLENNGLNLSIPGEIESVNLFYDYDAKYVMDSKIVIPSRRTDRIGKRVYDIAKRVIDIFDIRGIARIDFLYDEENDVLFFNEINTMPGFTSISMYSKLWEAEGICYKELITRLIETETNAK